MRLTRQNNLLIAIYFHPEAFPPTLNAIGELSECFNSISVLHRPHMPTKWPFPANVSVIPSGKEMSARAQEIASIPKKILLFLQFTRNLLRITRAQKPSTVLVYDSISLLAFCMIKPFLKKGTKLWYHNHDVTEPNSARKYSVGWFADRNEKKAFDQINIFSLPAQERIKYFELKNFTGRYFFVPNYPSKKFYSHFYSPKRITSPVRLIFQGAIGPFHGIEEIIPLLQEEINGYALELVLKGPCRENVKESYKNLAAKHNVSDKLIFAGVTPYVEVPAIAATCHIGIGILAKNDIMNTTLGTASNKLYEYAAVGLPVIYYNSESFVRYLRQYPWAIATGLSIGEIRQAIATIMEDYDALSAAAHADFMNGLNFESGFADIKGFICQNSLTN